MNRNDYQLQLSNQRSDYQRRVSFPNTQSALSMVASEITKTAPEDENNCPMRETIKRRHTTQY